MKEYEYATRAMGTDVTVSLVCVSEHIAERAAHEAFEIISAYEERFSRFIPESELSVLNKRRDMVVSDMFFSVLMRSLELAHETGGIFNPLMQIARFGYDRDFDALSDITVKANKQPYNINFDELEVNKHTHRVRLAKGQKIDFGGVLKGYLAERIAEIIEHDYPACTGIIINIGGDLHTRGHDENAEPFQFVIENPVTGIEYTLPLTDTSLATSGVYKRVWSTDVGAMHHILGIDGGMIQAPLFVSASVSTRDGAAAEAYAKVLLSAGPEKAGVLKLTSPYQYILVENDGTFITNKEEGAYESIS